MLGLGGSGSAPGIRPDVGGGFTAYSFVVFSTNKRLATDTPHTVDASSFVVDFTENVRVMGKDMTKLMLF